MVNENLMHYVCNYATNSYNITCPDDDQLYTGVIPFDELPAEWWNWLWRETNGATRETKSALDNVIAELVNVLTRAAVTPSIESISQLKQSISTIINHVGTSTIAGTVKSSLTGGNVSVTNDGTMIANGLGNADNLNTVNKNITGAITEVDSKYQQCYVDTCASIVSAYRDIVHVESVNAKVNCVNLGLGAASLYDTSCFITTSDLAGYALKASAAGATTSNSYLACASTASTASTATCAASITCGLCRYNNNADCVCCTYQAISTTYAKAATSASIACCSCYSSYLCHTPAGSASYASGSGMIVGADRTNSLGTLMNVASVYCKDQVQAAHNCTLVNRAAFAAITSYGACCKRAKIYIC